MKAYKIDCYNNVITTLNLGEDFREISNNIGCDLFCLAAVFNNNDTLYVDDEGLLKTDVTRGFTLDGQFFAGNGILLGCNDMGVSTDVRTDELEIAKRISFPPECFTISDEYREKAIAGWNLI
jgi:hypothetical protein